MDENKERCMVKDIPWDEEDQIQIKDNPNKNVHLQPDPSLCHMFNTLYTQNF